MEADTSTKFSPSKLSTYKECPRRYRFRYIDKVPRSEQSIEAFMGTCVHAALEELYRALMHAKTLTLKETLEAFDRAWREGDPGKIIIRDAKYSFDDWKALGKECVGTYYHANEPFDQNKTVDVEKRIGFSLPVAGESYRIEGFVDRLALAPDGAFEIHDYKTSRTLPTQEQKDADWQLPIYEIAVRDAWPETKDVRLVWHFVRFGKQIRSSRSPEELQGLKEEIGRTIEAIKHDHEFIPRQSALCDWCEYRSLCPLFSHPLRVAALPPELRRRDEGVKLVDHLSVLESRKRELKEELRRVDAEEDGLKEELSKFAEAFAISVIAGLEGEVSVSEKNAYQFPTKTHAPEQLEALEKELKATPLWLEASRIDGHLLMEGYASKKWPKEWMEAAEAVIGRYVKRTREKVLRFRRKKNRGEE